MLPESTIAALATAPMPAGIAVVRVSGPKTKLVLKALFRGKRDPVHLPRTLVFGEIVDFKSGATIDQALAVYMPAPWSFTGEDVAEFQFHGSPLLTQKILRSIFSYGVTPAAPGEFTRRAFLNNKLDLTQAEAIGDLIGAKSDEALKLAGEQLKGRFSKSIEDLGEPLRMLLAELEAGIDFPEEDIEPERIENFKSALSTCRIKIDRLIDSYSFGQVVKEGVRVLLCGRPNAGKSSLLNLLLGRNRAIVSPISGTTRDLIEEEATLGGYKFVFCDSAGLRDTSDEVESIGVELAKERMEWADLVLLVVDATDTDSNWRSVLDYLRPRAKRIWMVTNKVDLNPQAFSQFYCDLDVCQQNLYLSVKTRDGFDALVKALIDDVGRTMPDKAEVGEVVTNERHRECLIRANTAIDTALQTIQKQLPAEILSVDIRQALTALDEIVGRTYTEDILGLIFGKFCIGK